MHRPARVGLVVALPGKTGAHGSPGAATQVRGAHARRLRARLADGHFEGERVGRRCRCAGAPPWRRGLVTNSDTVRTAASAAPRGDGRLPQVFEEGSCGIAWVDNGLVRRAVGALTGIVSIWLTLVSTSRAGRRRHMKSSGRLRLSPVCRALRCGRQAFTERTRDYFTAECANLCLLE